MDPKKFSKFSSDGLLNYIVVNTDFGFVVKEAEFFCFRCGFKQSVKITDEMIEKVASFTCNGSELVEAEARVKHNWIIQYIRIGGSTIPYVLCSKCAEKDIKNARNID